MSESAAAPDRLNIASVVDQVYTAIRERISSGSLPRGERVHQEDLAEELGVSRTPVREALRRLAAEGLVEMRTNRGARVADVDQIGMRESYEARTVIEPGAARLAAALRPAEPLARMRAAGERTARDPLAD
ncbi:MAG: GntR family transcriptional regulator, partial [Solirubrobacteraceae bacterium]